MKTIKLHEASSLTAYDKMRLFDQGQRNENLKACGVPKLITFYHTCLNNGFKNAEKQVAAELTRRNLSIYLWPDITKIDATQFTPYEAQLLLKCKNDPDLGPLVSSIYQNPFPNLTQSETLLVYLVWSLVLDLPKFTNQFKVYFANQIYFSKVPQMVSDLLDQPGITDIIADIIKGLPPQYRQP